MECVRASGPNARKDGARLDTLEIQALVRIIDELTYYQILHVAPDASRSEIKAAYYATARAFHPDSNRELVAEMQKNCLEISKRITEAHCVLRDPRKRNAYDAKLADSRGVRMQLTEARNAHARQETEERGGRTPQGKQFLMKAQEDMRREDFASAIRNLQMAMTFEADNDYFKSLLEEARKRNK
jgi:DnaJ-class molecular chaperone